MSRVFIITHPGKHSVTAAEEFGRIVCLYKHGEALHRDRVELNVAEIVKRLDAHNFEPESDRICFVGSQVLNLQLALVVGMTYPAFNVMLYDVRTLTYVVRRLSETLIPDHVDESQPELEASDV